MKTYLTIIYTRNQHQSHVSLIRPGSAPTPTHRGAARMVAAKLSRHTDRQIMPSEVSVCRMEECCYQSR